MRLSYFVGLIHMRPLVAVLIPAFRAILHAAVLRLEGFAAGAAINAFRFVHVFRGSRVRLRLTCSGFRALQAPYSGHV